MLEQNLPWLDDVVRARWPERIAKHAKCYTFRHSFATHLLDDGYDIRAVQDLLERRDVTTTMIYTHVPQPRSGRRAQPTDRMLGA